MTELFIVLGAYEAVVMVIALAIYLLLAAIHRLKGAGLVAAAVLFNLAAAGVQASNASVRVLFSFDHNGIFHLVQMVGTAILGMGLYPGMEPGGDRSFRS